MKTSIKSKLNQAFSLIELLVVIAVIAVIAAIAIPNITGVREAAISAQAQETSNNIVRLAGQAIAAGAALTNAPTDITTWGPVLSNGTNITIPGTTNVVTFKLGN